MKELRRHGFTNRDVAVLVGGRWKKATIKRYTRGVKDVITEERDRVLETYSRFTAEGKTLQNVEDFLNMNRILESMGVSLDIVAEFIMKTTAQRVNLAQFMKIYSETEESEYTIEEILESIDVLKSLEQEGIPNETLKELNRETIKYGGLERLIQAISKYSGFEDIEKAIEVAGDILKRKKDEIKKIETEIETMHAEALTYISYMNVAKALVSEHEFDVYSLKTLVEVARKYGNPIQILEALSIYQNIEQLKDEITAIREENKRLQVDKKVKEAELVALERFIEKANRAVGEIEAGHKKSVTIKTIADIVYGGDEITIDPHRFKQISLLFLTGINRFAQRNANILGDWERNVSFFLKYAIEGVTKTL